MKNSKRLLALFLSLLMVFSMLPLAVFAYDEPSEDASITGIEVAGVAAEVDVDDETIYTVEVPFGTTVDADAIVVTATDSNATVGTPDDQGSGIWEIEVTAEDGTTTETYTVTVTEAAAPTAPTVPQNVTATVSSGRIVVSWTAPASNGGSVVTKYEVSLDGAVAIDAGMATSYTFTGLTNGTSYTITVVAVNAEGTSAGATITATPVSSGGGSTGGGSSSGGGSSTTPPKTEEKPAEPPVSPVQPVAPIFNDVSADAWYAENVTFVQEAGLMTGTSDGKFSPNTNMTRGMIVTVLHRLAGTPAAGSASFSDVASNAWYGTAAAWAQNSGIVQGFDGKFNPDGDITRQDLAVILVRYAQSIGFTLPIDRSLPNFADGANIADYAADAVNALYQAGVINGKDGNMFDATGVATRAEVAAMLNRFVELIK